MLFWRQRWPLSALHFQFQKGFFPPSFYVMLRLQKCFMDLWAISLPVCLKTKGGGYGPSTWTPLCHCLHWLSVSGGWVLAQVQLEEAQESKGTYKNKNSNEVVVVLGWSTQFFIALDDPCWWGYSCSNWGEGGGVVVVQEGRLNSKALGISPKQDLRASSVQVDVELDAQGVTYFPL